MGIFGSIMHKLGFGDDKVEEQEASISAGDFGAAAAAAAANVKEVVSDTIASVQNLASTEESAVEVVDVAGKLDDLAANNSEDLDWKNSIVDLMKLLGLDSSYGHRKELAAEVGIEGYHGSEEQNIELHKVVLAKLAASGGNVPADLLG
jgi:hypothetical protein